MRLYNNAIPLDSTWNEFYWNVRPRRNLSAWVCSDKKDFITLGLYFLVDVNTTQEVDRFQWMPREYLIILTYLTTVMLNMQSGSLQRAQHAAEKAFVRIEKLSNFDANPLLTVFQLSLLEHTIMGRLVMGDKTKAVEGVGQACKLCHVTPALMHRRRPQLHTLIGLYAMSMNCMDQAEEQFKLALRVSHA